jgi:hypothetical protein
MEIKLVGNNLLKEKYIILILKGHLFWDLSLSLIYFTIDKYENKTSW